MRVSIVGSQTPNYRTWCLRFPLNLTFHLKTLGKLKQTKPKANRRKETTNIKTEINETDDKKRKKSMKPKSGSLKMLTNLWSVRQRKRLQLL